MARSSKRTIIKAQEPSQSAAALPIAKSRELPSASTPHSRFNSFIAATQFNKLSPQPQPPPRRSSPYSQAVELTKSRSVSALKPKELKKNPVPEMASQLRKDLSYKRLIEKPVLLNKTSSLKPRKISEPKPMSHSFFESHSNTPSLNSSAVQAAAHCTTTNTSFSASLVEPSYKSPKELKDKLQLKIEAKSLESQLAEKLASAADDALKFKVYQGVFDEVIYKVGYFGSLLTKIKLGYEDWLYADRQSVTDRLKTELSERTGELARTKQEHSQLVKRISKLAKENGDLSRAQAETEEQYMELHERLMKLTQVKCDGPKDETSWQYLLSENKQYAEVLKTLHKDLKHLKRREDKLLKLMQALKVKGYPIEQIYKEECRKQKQAKLPYTVVKGSDAGDEDAEPIVNGPPKAVERPKGVPVLALQEVEPDLASESESGSEYTDSAASSSSGQSQVAKALIPKLSFGREQKEGFHQEFMSKFNDFSESWRKQIEHEQRSCQ
jgi:hypothetical protein